MTSDFAPYGLHRSRKQEFFEGENIVSLRKTSEPTFTYVDFPCYVSQTFFILKPKGIDMKLLTGILNSKVIHFWLRNKGKKQGGLLQIDKAPLLDLPIVLPKNRNDELSNSIINAVDAIINFIKNVNSSKSESDKEVYRNKIKFETDRLDTLIFELYGLNKDEISEINKFLKDNN
jgi:adenine-specific DNA-methyltransferase